MTPNPAGPGTESGYVVVPSEEYPTIQDAHDELPPEGGTIWLQDTVEETDVVLEKPVKIVGQGAASATTPGAVVDTAGGDGIHVAAEGVTLRDVHVTGDRTGGYGIKLAGTDSRSFGGKTVLDNVVVEEKGGHGVLVDGGQLNNRLDVSVWDCAGDGWHFQGDWFNEHSFDRMVACGCDGDGVHIAQTIEPDPDGHQVSRFTGNTVDQFWMEVNDGWGLYVEDGVRFEGNHFTGYGIEHNQDYEGLSEHTEGPDGQANKVLKVSNLGCPRWREGPSGNAIHVKNLHTGTIEIDREEFETLVATNVVTEDGRVELLQSPDALSGAGSDD